MKRALFVALPDNSISMLGGDEPFGPIEMGGMFTIVKVRKQLSGDQDPGWFQHPPEPWPAKQPPPSSRATVSKPDRSDNDKDDPARPRDHRVRR